MAHTREEQLKAFDRLLTVMDELREKCPWDRKQTFESLRQNTIEETYELASALIQNDMNEIAKELGDVLLHVVFYAKIGSEKGAFDIADVCNKIADKLIFRHPHVYGEQAVENAEDVSKLWEQVKLKEKFCKWCCCYFYFNIGIGIFFIDIFKLSSNLCFNFSRSNGLSLNTHPSYHHY